MRTRRPGDSPGGLLFALVACGCLTVWVVGAGVLLLTRPGDNVAAGGWACVIAGSVVLVGLAAAVVSLLRGPTTIVVHDEAATSWSLRTSPVPLRLATSARLAAGSRGEALAAQVVRAAVRDERHRVDVAHAVPVLQQILEIAASDDEKEWSRVRAAVVDLTLRASDHPPHPVTVLPWEEHLTSPR